MAKVDLNAVLDGHDNPRVGDEYEVAPGKWGKMKAPTQELQLSVQDALSGASNDGDVDFDSVVSLVLDGLPDYNPKNAIAGMREKVVQDFFILLTRTVRMLNDASGQLAP